MTTTGSPSTSTTDHDLSFIFDNSKTCVIDERKWREQQAAVESLKRWYYKPAPVVLPFLDGTKSMAEATPKEMEALKRHLAHDPVAYAHLCAVYVDIDKREWRVGSLTPGQLVILWKFTVLWHSGIPVRMILLKQRRGGFSFIFAVIMSWIHFFHENRGGTSVANEKNVSIEITKYIRDIWERLPDPVRPAKRYSSKSEFTLEEPKEAKRLAGNGGLKSFLKIESVGADYVGTGSPIQAAHLSEAGKWEKACNPEVQYTSITNTIPEAAFTFIGIESTAHGAETFFHGMWRDAMKMVGGEAGWNGFTPIFIPWYFDHRNRRPAPSQITLGSSDKDDEFGDEVTERRRYDLDVEQIMWRRLYIAKQTRRKGAGLFEKIAMFRQEFPGNPEEAWRFAGGRFLQDSAMQEIRRRCRFARDPIFVGELDAVRGGPTNLRLADVAKGRRMGPFRVWREPEPGNEYIVAADVASGEASDSSCARIYHRHLNGRLLLCAEWYGLILPDRFTHILWRLGWLYNCARMGWERTGPGMSIGSWLREDHPNGAGDAGIGYPVSQLYRPARSNNARVAYEATFGINTSPVSKRPMLDRWVGVATNGGIELTDEDLEEAGSRPQDESDPRKVETKGADRFMASVFAVEVHTFTPSPVAPSMEERRRPRQGTVDEADAWVDAQRDRAMHEGNFTSYDRIR